MTIVSLSHNIYFQIRLLYLEILEFTETHQTMQYLFNLYMSYFGEPFKLWPSGFSWQVWCPVRSSAAGYSFCCLSIISNQYAHSPLTPDINKVFSYTQLLFKPFSVNPKVGCAWTSQQNCSSWKQTSLSGTNNHTMYSHLSSLLWCNDWTCCLHHIMMSKCIEFLLCDWIISYLR